MLIFVLCIINYTNSFSQSSDEWLIRGNKKIDSNKYYEALDDLSKAIELSKKEPDPAYYINRARALYEIEDYNGSISD